MAGYIGGRVAISSPQQIETKHTLTATASQTSIPNIGYTVGAVHVYQNGVRLVDGTDYTATNGSTVTLETGATEGDQIVIVSHGSFETGDVVSKASGGTFAAGITANGDITASGGTVLVAGDTSAGDDAAIGYTSAEGLILTGQGTTNDVTIKNDADADVIEIPTGTVNVTMAGTLGVTGVITGGGLVVPDGSIALVDLDIDGGTDIGAALVDADLMIVDDGAGGTNRKATMSRLATYINTKVAAPAVAFPSDWASADETFTSSATYSKHSSLANDDYVWFFLLGGGGGGSVNDAGFGGSVRLIFAKAGLLNGAAFVVGAGSDGVNSGSAAAGGQTILTLSSGNGSSVFATPTDDTNNILNVVTAPTPNVSGTYLNGGPDEAYGFSTKPLPSGYEKLFTGTYAQDVIFGGARGTATNQAASTSLLSGNGGVNTGGDGAAPGGGGAAGHGSGQIGGDGVAGNVRVYHV